MRVTSAYKRILLEHLFAQSVAQSITLRDSILALGTARVGDTSGGLFLTATSGNGHAVQFSIPAAQSPIDVAETAAELLDLHDESKTALGGTPSDADIKAEMLFALKPCRAVHDDFTSLRLNA